MKGAHFRSRKIRRLEFAKRDVETTIAVVTAQAVVAMAVQVQEQRGLLAPIFVFAALFKTGPEFVEFFPQRVITLGRIVLGGEPALGVVDERIALRLQRLIQADQIRIDIGQAIVGKLGVEKNGTGANERLEQAFARRQGQQDMRQHAKFAAGPFQKWPLLGRRFDQRRRKRIGNSKANGGQGRGQPYGTGTAAV